MREFIYVRTVTKRRRAQISQDPRNEFCRTQTSKEFFVVSLLSSCLHFDTIECSSKPNSVYSFTFSLAINRYQIDGFCSRCPESSPTKQIVQLSSFHIISMSPRKFDAIHFCHAMKKGWENMVIAKWLERNSAQKQHFGQTRWFFCTMVATQRWAAAQQTPVVFWISSKWPWSVVSDCAYLQPTRTLASLRQSTQTKSTTA